MRQMIEDTLTYALAAIVIFFIAYAAAAQLGA